jgi:hypothetical protein
VTGAVREVAESRIFVSPDKGPSLAALEARLAARPATSVGG